MSVTLTIDGALDAALNAFVSRDPTLRALIVVIRSEALELHCAPTPCTADASADIVALRHALHTAALRAAFVLVALASGTRVLVLLVTKTASARERQLYASNVEHLKQVAGITAPVVHASSLQEVVAAVASEATPRAAAPAPVGGADAGGSLAVRNPLFTFFRRSDADKFDVLESEFGRLRQVDQEVWGAGSFSVGSCERNRGKNRYSDVLPFDLNVYPANTLYINGSLIGRELPNSAALAPHEFVASQAPLADHIDEWWRALAHSNAGLIVMLTQECEGGSVKAHRYWPLRVGEPTGMPCGTLSLLSESEAAPRVFVRELSLTPSASASAPPFHVRQLQYCAWPDHGVPASTDGFLCCLRNVQAAARDRPVFVHCSAGIGRTGTLIAVYHALCLAQSGELRDGSIYEIVNRLKRARPGMVQRREQYAFIYQCVSDLLRASA